MAERLAPVKIVRNEHGDVEVQIGALPDRGQDKYTQYKIETGLVSGVIDRELARINGGVVPDYFAVIVVGKIYKGRSDIGWATKLTDARSVNKALFSGSSQRTIEQAIQTLFNWTDTPERIAGIILRPL